MKKNEITKLDAGGGREISVRQWSRPENKVSIVYVHGIQSHSGWAVETGEWLLAEGINMFAYDRAGSGASGGPKGHLETYGKALADLGRVIKYVKDRTGTRYVFVMALCWGAKVASLYEIKNPGNISGIILLTPGIKAKLSVPLSQKVSIFLDLIKGGRSYFPLPLKDDMFTGEDKYLRFISEDRSSLKEATSRFLFETLRMDFMVSRQYSRIRIPVLCFLAGRDPIVDNDFISSLMKKVNSEVVTYPDVLHSIEFNSTARIDMLERVKKWICLTAPDVKIQKHFQHVQ
jgi:alpha-beta hydrolase superfamily lysophospholipase